MSSASPDGKRRALVMAPLHTATAWQHSFALQPTHTHPHPSTHSYPQKYSEVGCLRWGGEESESRRERGRGGESKSHSISMGPSSWIPERVFGEGKRGVGVELGEQGVEGEGVGWGGTYVLDRVQETMKALSGVYEVGHVACMNESCLMYQ